LDYYTALQIAQTLTRPLPVMAETLVFSTNFCCLSRESSLIEICGNLMHPAVSCFRETEKSTIASQS